MPPIIFLVCLLRLLLSFPDPVTGYTLKDSYEPSNFFSKFDFFTAADETDGFVE